ncbi:MAG: prepilin-type N-terminal cleavage/methylation domain-containing protein [Candidatus Aminicenantes bacterium]|nr:MAG: prepilin-type N-terminal cleavage/methylation domain-containing protein [Candidatus Aminicenantes bacterium]TET69088.1 MAG: prepilin-type N-terminal cleavage/methylation domain-containing protein [Candidatus Aminicenantes bacterium]
MDMSQKRKGFTLIELMIVFTLIGILVGLGLPQYRNALRKGREAVLKADLFQMRKLINQYYTDQWKYPSSLQVLVDEKYLMKIPIDPMTKSSETWVEVYDTLTEDDLITGVEPGVIDVLSGSDEKALDGTPYNTW